MKKLQDVWQNMKQRCLNKKNPSYDLYGSRGIDICNEWSGCKSDYFILWALQNGYKEGLELDRIDNNKGYSPENCRWATRETQTQNTRVLCSNNTTGYRGVSLSSCKTKYRTSIMVNKEPKYLGTYTTALQAAKAYDYYVISNSLTHTINSVLEEGETIDIEAHTLLSSANTSGYLGVSKRKSGWTARIRVNGIYKSLGIYSTPEEAAKVRDKFIDDNNLPNKKNFKE